MELIRVLKLVWMLITLVATFAKGQDQHAGPPDIMMYYNYRESQVTCVAGTNTYGNAVTFITPLTYRVNPVFQYKDANGSNNEEIACDYEKRQVDKQCIPIFTNIMSSGKYLTSPVTDERWNKFETQYTAGGIPEYSYMYSITETNFHISFSVRTSCDAQILLCNSQGSTPKYHKAKCYWILIDANDYKNEIFLRKCSEGIPDDFPKGNDNPCRIPRAHNKEVKLLSDKKWTHFTVTRENGNTINLWESNHTTPILKYTDEKPFDIGRLYIRGTNREKAEWKIHDYRYLVITKMNQYIKLGTQFSVPTSDTLCISLHVAVCSRCAMEIRIQSDSKIEATKTIYGKQGLFIPWQLEKIKVQVHSNFINSIYILATAEAGVTDTFWAVDDIRRCYSDEIKVSSIQVAQQAINSITCQSLQYPEWNFTASRNINNSIECSDSHFTGTYCNISCKSLLRSDYCENNMICRPTVLDAPTQCTCAPNSSGPQCITGCPDGYFGYNCQNKCGKCQGGIYSCDKLSGKCSSGCEEGYTPPHCTETIGPVLLAPPTVISVSHTSVTIRLDNITTLGDRTADTFQIEYKLAGNAGPWKQDTRRVQLAKNIEVTVSELQQETTYSIRVVLYAFNGDTYRLENVPYTNATTTCEDDVNDLELLNNVTVESYSRSVHIKWIRPACANILGSLGYNISIKCIHDPWCDQVKPVTREIDGFRNNVSVDTLTPFTNYTLELRASRNSTISEQKITLYFTTKEGAPPVVRSLKDYSRDGDFISLRWLAPYPPHGTLDHYEVEYCYYYYSYCSYRQKKQVYPVPCSLWDEDEYLCFDITNTEPSYKYSISVRAKNTGVIGYGAANAIETTAVQYSPSVPLNLNATWNQNMLILHWDCPDLPGGPLKYFLITLRQFDTEILANKGQNKQYDYKLEVDKQPLRKYYNYTINQTIPYSTSYNITVCGVNNFYGAQAKTDVNTPPETPVPSNPSSVGLYALLLLLFVPVLLYFLYRRTMSKSPGSSSRDNINIPSRNIPRTEVASYIEIIQENGTGSPSPDIQMTDRSNELSIYDTVKNNAEVPKLTPIYDNITTEATYANVTLARAPVLRLPENIDVNMC